MIDQNDIVQLKSIFSERHHIHSGSDTPRIDYRDLTNSPLKLGFGGDGSDGDLIITSGTTTIDLGSAKVVVKNYRYLSVTGTASIAFSNPNSAGTIVMLLVSADYTITSSTNPAIDLRSIGGLAGTGATGGGGVAPGGGGGASVSANGSNGVGMGGTAGTAGGNGTGYGTWIPATSQTGGQSITPAPSGAPGGVSPLYNSAYGSYAKAFLIPGSGGGGGSAATGVGNGTGGNGGRGGGALYVECRGRYLVTSTINLAGGNGVDGVTKEGGGGGGGGGGCYVALYNTLTANSGTYTVGGGSGGNFATGGTASTAGGAGADGYSLVAKNTIFA